MCLFSHGFIKKRTSAHVEDADAFFINLVLRNLNALTWEDQMRILQLVRLLKLLPSEAMPLGDSG